MSFPGTILYQIELLGGPEFERIYPSVAVSSARANVLRSSSRW
jgi:hypothetical protein